MPPIENSPHKTGKSMLFFTFEMPLFSVMSINSQIYMTKPKQAQKTLSENTGKTFSVIMPPFSSKGGTLIQLVQTQGTVFLRRSIHFSDAPEFLRCSTKIDPTTVDLSDAVIISQMLRENVLEWLTYLYHSHQFYILYGMGDSSRWSASDHRQLLRSHRHA